VNVPREKLFEAAKRIMGDAGLLADGVMDIVYADEEGTGIGPTLEFYSLISKEVRSLPIWRDSGHETGLFPVPVREADIEATAAHFEFIGRLVAKAIFDDRLVDLPLSPAFWKLVFRRNYSVMDLYDIDKDLANTMTTLHDIAARRQEILDDPTYSHDIKARLIDNLNFKGVKIDDLQLVFTLPGHDEIELRPNGKN
jgi:E3 ubiquitin-protein ligase TRIP12